MTVNDVYELLTSGQTAEQALKTMIGVSINKQPDVSETQTEELIGINIANFAVQLGWGMAIPSADEEGNIDGMILGTEEYIDSLISTDSPDDDGDCCDSGQGCGGCGCH